MSVATHRILTITHNLPFELDREIGRGDYGHDRSGFQGQAARGRGAEVQVVHLGKLDEVWCIADLS